MTNDKIYNHNVATDEITVFELSDQEQALRDAQVNKATQDAEKAKADAETLRQTKIAAYQKLGLSEAEIEALLPTPLPDLPISELRKLQHNL